MTYQIGSVQRPARGEQVCGDAIAIVHGEVTTIAMADGLGHGPKAAEAAQPFCSFVEGHAGDGLAQIMVGAAQTLRGTRGAAAAVVRMDLGLQRLEFVGVGNIVLKSLSEQPIRPFCTPGIVGRGKPKVHVFEFPLSDGDLIVLFSDGISERFELTSYRHLSPQRMAESILDDHGKYHDDATCVVVCC